MTVSKLQSNGKMYVPKQTANWQPI